jgi:hypothetical protein
MRMMIAWCVEFNKMMYAVRAGDHQKGQKRQHHTERAQASVAL